MNQLTNTAKKLDTFFKILNVFLIIAIVAALVALAVIGAGFLFDLDLNTIGGSYTNLEFGFLSIGIAENYVPDEWYVQMLLPLDIVVTLICLLIARHCITCVRDILQPMTQGQPFHNTISENLKKLAKNSMILCILVNFIDIATTCMYVWGYDLANLILSDKITHVSFLTTFDLTFLIVAAVLYLLSYIFRYGEELQQLSDETL